MMMERRVEPEWLDQLPADDPRAVAARRDLRRINIWMGQAGIMNRLLSRIPAECSPARIVDLGGGDGTFALRAVRRLAARWPGVTLALVDQQAIVSGQTRNNFAALGWKVEAIEADVFTFLKEEDRPADIIIANLFLHHFARDRLRDLLTHVAQRTGMFIACEPRRARIPHLATGLLWVIGCNDVSRHDARVSVEAGFNGSEISATWPDEPGWRLSEHAAGPFTHCFIANGLGRSNLES